MIDMEALTNGQSLDFSIRLGLSLGFVFGILSILQTCSYTLPVLFLCHLSHPCELSFRPKLTATKEAIALSTPSDCTISLLGSFKYRLSALV